MLLMTANPDHKALQPALCAPGTLATESDYCWPPAFSKQSLTELLLL